MAAFKSQRNGKTPPAVIIKANGNHRLTMGHRGGLWKLKTGLRGFGEFRVLITVLQNLSTFHSLAIFAPFL
jgi:hypothetical protein